MIRKTLLLIAILGFTQIKAQDTTVWSLNSCIDYALQQNLQIKKQQLTVDMFTNNFKSARFERLPGVYGDVSESLNYGRSYSQDKSGFINTETKNTSIGISANATLFNGFRIENTIKQKQLELESSQNNLKVQANDIALQIVNYYLQILFNREQGNALKQQLIVTKQQIDRTNLLIAAGSVSKGDVLELKAQASNENSQIVSYTNLELQSITNLRQLMNLNSDTIIIQAPKTINIDSLYVNIPKIKEIYQTAVQFSPEIKSAKVSVEAKRQQVKVAKSGYYPTLSLSAVMGSRYNNQAIDMSDPTSSYNFSKQIADYKNENISFSLSIPIFNKFRTKYNVQNAQVEVAMANTDLDIELQNLYKKLESALNDAHAAFESYNASKSKVDATTESFYYAKERLNAGLMNSVDYNLAKNNLTNAQIELLNARYQLIFKVKILDFYMGKKIII